MRDSKTSCQIKESLRLEVRQGHSSYIPTHLPPLIPNIVIDHVDVSISELIRTGIKVWEIESLWLEPYKRDSLNPKVIGSLYHLRSNPYHWMALLWLGYDSDEVR